MRNISRLFILTFLWTISFTHQSIAVTSLDKSGVGYQNIKSNLGKQILVNDNPLEKEQINKKPKKKNRKKRNGKKWSKAKKLLMWTIITAVGGILLLVMASLAWSLIGGLSGLVLLYLFGIIGVLSLSASSILYVIWLIEAIK